MSGRAGLAPDTTLPVPIVHVRPWLKTMGPPLVAAAVALVLAWSAMLPGVAFWDTGEFQTVAPVLGTAHSPGFPTYVILGWLASAVLTPFGDPAFRMNLFAGLCVAAAAGLTTVLVHRLTGRSTIAVAAGIGLAAAPLAWRIGTHAEPHALHLAFVGLILVLLVHWAAARAASNQRADRWLVVTAGTFGLAAGNHSLTLLLAPAIAAYLLAVDPTISRRPRLIGACAAALVGTLVLVYLELPIRAGLLPAPLVYGRPDTWDGFWYVALAQQFQGAVGNPFADLPGKTANLVALAGRELGALSLLLPAAAIITIRRFPHYALLSGLAVAVTVVFAASYANADISRYYLGPLLIAWTWLGVLGATIVDAVTALIGPPPARPGLRAGAPVPAPPGSGPTFEAARGAGVAGGIAVLLLLPTVLAIPARHTAIDQRSDRGARVWTDSALDQIAQNAVVVSWWSYSTPLWYAQHVEGRRPDIFVVDDRTRLDLTLGEATDVIARFRNERPVYVIRANQHDLGLVRARYDLLALSGPAANVYEVIGPAMQPT